jgi:cytochrome c peroxidase
MVLTMPWEPEMHLLFKIWLFNVLLCNDDVSHLDLQPIIPLTSEIEMKGFKCHSCMMKRTKPTVNSLKFLWWRHRFYWEHAQSTFSIYGHATSSNSKFDHYRRNEAVPSLLTSSWKYLFNTKCASCHATDLMTDAFRNNGLAINPLINDVGRYRNSTRTRLLQIQST